MGIHRAVPAPRRPSGASCGASGLGGDILCVAAHTHICTHTFAHTHLHTVAQEVSALPPWSSDPDLCVTPSPWSHTTGLGWQEGHPTPHTWHVGICLPASFPSLTKVTPAGGALREAGSGPSRRERQRGNETRRYHFLPECSGWGLLAHPATGQWSLHPQGV